MRSLREWLGGQAVLPIAVLAGLNLVDEFDRIAYATLTPEIRDAFGTTDTVVNTISTLSAVTIVLTAVPTGRATDRCSRVRLSLLAAALWATCSVLTGIVPTIALLVVVRILSGVGRNANEVVHPSLISDLYRPDTHPRVFFLQRLGNPVAQASGILAGVIADTAGWRWAFVLLALPTVVLAVLLVGVADPPRRGLSRASLDLSLGEAARQLRELQSLPRLWAAAFFLGAAALGIFQLISVFLEQQFGLGATGRGVAQFLVGLGWIVGIFVGARLADGLAHERAGHLVKVCSGGFAVIGLGALVVGFSPALMVALVAATIMASGNGLWQAPYFTAVGRIAPAGLSGQAYASSTIFYALGALLSVPVFVVGDVVNYRLAFTIVAGFAFVAALIGRSAAPRVEADLAAVRT